MKIKKLLVAAAAALMLCACSTPENVYYFKDLNNGMTMQIADAKLITFKPEDKILIVVNSKDPQITSLFNFPYVSRQLGAANAQASNSQGIVGYSVDQDGYIDFPMLGKVKAGGKTRSELADYIKEQLTVRLVKDPTVAVEYMNLTYQVLGEVKSPGRYSIDKDCTTLYDALSRAGDLTIYGKRDKVIVQRQEGNEMKAYIVDLKSAQNVLNSPVFYLQQNDIVYVEPNDVRARQATVNGNNVRSTSFWMSLASLLTSVTNTAVVLSR